MLYRDYLKSKYQNTAAKLANAEGVPCVLEYSKGKNIRNYEVYGNSVQDGTPSPVAPVEIQSVGDRTKNLYNANDLYIPVVADEYYIIQFVSDEDIYKSIELYDENKSNQINIVQYAYKDKTYNTWIVKPKQSGFLRAYFALAAGKPDPAGELMITQGLTISLTSSQLTSLNDKQFVRMPYKTSGFPNYEPYNKYDIPITVTGTSSETTHIYLDEPLRKVGDYADYIDFKNQKVVRNTIKGVLNGSEAWKASGTRYYYQNTNLNIKCLGTSVAGIISNALPSMAWSKIRNSGTGIATYSDNRIDIRADGVWRTVDEAKEYLTNNSIYYIAPRLEPLEETIKLPILKTFKGTNVISVDTTVLPRNIKADYIRT